MIYKFEITPLLENGSDKTLILDLYDPESSGFAIKNVTGLGPVKASLTMSKYATKNGSKFQGSRQDTRSINLQLEFFDTLLTAEEIRHKSYRYFPIGKKVKVEITTDTRVYITTGYVESNEPTIWGQDKEGTTVVMTCESPYFYSEQEIEYRLQKVNSAFHFPFSSLVEPELLFGYLYSGNELEINNTGDVETGCIMEITALQDISNPLIYNLTKQSYFGVNINMDAGDKIIANTNVGAKGLYLKKGEDYYNIINNVKDGSSWFNLDPGKTVFAVSHGDEITRIFSDKEAEFYIYRHNYSIDYLAITTSVDSDGETKPTIDNPHDIKIADRINFTVYKEYWHDENTDPSQYDYTSKSMSYDRSIADIISDDEEATITAEEFGSGYLDVNLGALQVTNKKITVDLADSSKWETIISDNAIDKVKQRYYLVAMFRYKGTELEPYTELYSNRFVYHPEFNGASSVDDIVYYFGQMGTEINACYWDNEGKICLLIAENWDTYSHSHFKYHKAKKKVYWKKHKKKTKTIKSAYYSTSFNASWFSNNNTYLLSELSEETKIDSDSFDDICDFALFDSAIVNKIKITTVDDLLVDMKIHKNVNYVYEYYTPDVQSSEYTISNGTAGELMYFRAWVNYNANGYTNIIFKINEGQEDEIVYEIDWSTIIYNEEDYNCPYKWEKVEPPPTPWEDIYIQVPNPEYDETKPQSCPLSPTPSSEDEKPDPFYGGWIDPINGILTNMYDANGNILETPEEIDISDAQINMIVPNGEYTISMDSNVGVITHLIYPVESGILLDRMNLVIKFNNYYIGI